MATFALNGAFLYAAFSTASLFGAMAPVAASKAARASGAQKAWISEKAWSLFGSRPQGVLLRVAHPDGTLVQTRWELNDQVAQLHLELHNQEQRRRDEMDALTRRLATLEEEMRRMRGDD